MSELKRSVTNLRVTFEQMVSEGNKIMDIHRVEANKREGAKITARVISLWVIENGKIVLRDELTHLEQGAPEDHDLGSRTSVAVPDKSSSRIVEPLTDIPVL